MGIPLLVYSVYFDIPFFFPLVWVLCEGNFVSITQIALAAR